MQQVKAKSKAQPLAPSNAQNLHAGKAIEEIYQKKSQLEHILLRPDTYIGSTEKQEQQLWVHDGGKMVYKTIKFVPGLYKIFDEILVNAADNKVRDASQDTIRVQLDAVRTQHAHHSCPKICPSTAASHSPCAGHKLHPSLEQW